MIAAASIEQELETHRAALTGYCYRMLGSGAEAEDAVQETMVRAWRASGRLQARGALKAWLYRIASNVCFDMLDSTRRRALPMDMGPSSAADAALGAERPEHAWVQPVVDSRLDPADLAERRETLRLAFVAALQRLPARQRAVLILCEVLRWRASEVAELLETSVASVNSALQRARATMAASEVDTEGPATADDEQQELLERYVAAFEAYDIESLVTLLREDARFSMPPFPLWIVGPEQVLRFMRGTGAHCEGSRLLTTSANGGPAVGVYHPAGPGRWEPWAVVVLEMSDGRISGLHHFLYPGLFAEFGLPAHLES